MINKHLDDKYKFLIAQTISLFGSSIVQYAIIWHITLTTSSGAMLSISTLCGFVPQILIAFFAGSWIDKYDRKKIIMIADIVIAVTTLLLVIAITMGFEHISLLFIVLAVRSAGNGVQTPAVNAFIPEIVPNEQLMKVNGLFSTLSSMTMFLAPAISGFILAFASLGMTLYIDIITAIIGVGITATIKTVKRKVELSNRTSNIASIKLGFAYIKKQKQILKLLIYQAIILLLISPSAFLTPLLVNRTFGMEVWRLSMSEMTYSFGMIVGGLLISAWGGFTNRIKTTLVAGAVYGGVMIVIGRADLFIVYLIANASIGISSPCYNTPITVYIQERVETSMHGRVFSFMQIASSCALPLGMVVFGPLADIFSIQSIMMINGVVVVLFSLFKLIKVKQYA